MKKFLATTSLAALTALGSLTAHADPVTAIGGAIIQNELPKCANGVGVPGGCVGPNGEIRKFAERNIVGPLKDVASGEIGRSDKSVWRQMGLPRIRLW
jgi:hypothetical protein